MNNGNRHMSPLLDCKHLQGKHCIKIGSKCVEKRWFNNDRCLLKERMELEFGEPPVKPNGPPKRKTSLGIVCSICGAEWGICIHSKHYGPPNELCRPTTPPNRK